MVVSIQRLFRFRAATTWAWAISLSLLAAAVLFSYRTNGRTNVSFRCFRIQRFRWRHRLPTQRCTDRKRNRNRRRCERFRERPDTLCRTKRNPDSQRGLNYAWSPASGLSATTGNPGHGNAFCHDYLHSCRDRCKRMSRYGLPGAHGISASYRFTRRFSAVCANAPAFTLTGGTPAGGTYSGLGVSSGSFNPASVGAGNYAIQYTYTDGNGCSASASPSITVNPAPTVTIGSFSPACANSSPFALTGGSPVGGTYSGPGVAPAYSTRRCRHG